MTELQSVRPSSPGATLRRAIRGIARSSITGASKYIEGEQVRRTPPSVRGEHSLGDWQTLTPDERRNYIRTRFYEQARPLAESKLRVTPPLRLQLYRVLGDEDRALVDTWEAGPPSAPFPALSIDTAPAPPEVEPPVVEAVVVEARAAKYTGAYVVACACGCGRMLPAPSRRPVLRYCAA